MLNKKTLDKSWVTKEQKKELAGKKRIFFGYC